MGTKWAEQGRHINGATRQQRRERNSDLKAIKGILIGLMISIPMWIILGIGVWKVWG